MFRATALTAAALLALATLGGDDLVCVTGNANGRVDAGDGNDVVDRSRASEEFTTTILGRGSDQFVGSAASEVVSTGTSPRRSVVDRDRDVIDGGPAGPDYGDYVISGEPGQPNPDEIHLAGGTSGRGGSAGTVELDGQPTPQTVVDGGRGAELTLDTTDAHRVTIDTAAGSYTRDGATAVLTRFDDFLISNDVETRYLDVRGSDRDESITMTTTRNSAYDIRMGGGDDKVSPLTLLHDQLLRCRTSRARFEGGGGNDKLIGDAGRDVLIGGRGRDLANGGPGRDTCLAERTKRCEVRR